MVEWVRQASGAGLGALKPNPSVQQTRDTIQRW
jgi:hypothetical protein